MKSGAYGSPSRAVDVPEEMPLPAPDEIPACTGFPCPEVSGGARAAAQSWPRPCSASVDHGSHLGHHESDTAGRVVG